MKALFRAGAVIALVLLVSSPPSSSSAQEPRIDTGNLQMSRGELEELLSRLEIEATSSAYSERLRERARRQADMIRDRLRNGDFRVGDRIVLQVETEPQLSDTFPVLPGPSISLPVIGGLSLEGVLRAELESYLTEHLSQYIRDPRVHARSLVRLALMGQVANPGFYVLPADMLVGEALMEAGGPARDAEMDDLRIDRGNRTIWEGRILQDAVADGSTLDQLNLRAGDQIVLPEAPDRSHLWTIGRYVLIAASTLLLGVRVF